MNAGVWVFPDVPSPPVWAGSFSFDRWITISQCEVPIESRAPNERWSNDVCFHPIGGVDSLSECEYFVGTCVRALACASPSKSRVRKLATKPNENEL